MLRDLIKKQIFPSPLLLETIYQEDWMKQIALYALCDKESACGLCPQCKQVLKGHHPDWLNLNGEEGTEALRNTLVQLRKRPFQAKRRVLTIYHMASANLHFQNTLLKTLEEPQEHWVIVLGVRSIYSLLETIRSRCLVFRDPVSLQEESLEASEEKIYNLLTEGQELEAFQDLEKLFKDRKKTKSVIIKFLSRASREGYPGYWQKLAPELEAELEFYPRNIHAKIIWAKAAAHASAS